MTTEPPVLRRTALYGLHRALGAKFVPFAGYEMPVQYPEGVLREHLHTREKAGLFDVSHMGQAFLHTAETALGSEEAHCAVADALETLVPGEIRKLKKGGLRYSLFLNDEGGILDDLMITRPAEDARQGSLFLVVNAAVKERDFTLLKEKLGVRTTLDVLEGRSLLAIQGPKAASVVDALLPGSGGQGFMTMRARVWNEVEIFVSRCGYTGEDGFEISVPDSHAEGLARALLDHPDVALAGLGARDSLRLEAGLCLYGRDIDETTSPVEADLVFAIGKRRREEGGFPGAPRILKELAEGAKRKRVGIRPEGRAPAREGTEIHSEDGTRIGVVTSGGFGPSVNGPVAMGYVAADFAAPGTALNLIVRGKALAARVAATPFTPHRYYRG